MTSFFEGVMSGPSNLIVPPATAPIAGAIALVAPSAIRHLVAICLIVSGLLQLASILVG